MRATGRLQRVEIEGRARRLASAVITAHAACDGHARGRTDGAEAHETLAERIDDLGAIVLLLPRLHGLRIAAEHACEVHARWQSDPVAESLTMAVAMSLLDRMIDETDTAFRAAA